MRIRWGALLTAALVVVATTGCTGRGEDEVRTDEDGATASYRSAVEHTTASSGRFTMSFDDEDAPDATATGSFSGRDLAMELSTDGFGSTRFVRTGDASWVDGAGSGFTDDDLHGKQWVQVTPVPTDAEGFGFGMLPDLTDAGPADVQRLTSSLLHASGIHRDGTDTVDGVAVDRYRGTLSASRLAELTDLAPTDEESGPRWSAAMRYLDDHTTVDLAVLVQDGAVRRVTITTTPGIEQRYEDCTAFAGVSSSSTTRVDFTHLGEPVLITAPDPATVLSVQEAMSVEDDGSGDDGSQMLRTADGDVRWDDVYSRVADDATRLHLDVDAVDAMSDDELVAAYDRAIRLPGNLRTSAGTLRRDDVRQGLYDDGARAGITPEQVDGLDDPGLVAAYDRMVAAQGPQLDTDDGTYRRSEVVEMTQADAASIGLDPATVPAMSDADLVAAYNRELDAVDVGDGGLQPDPSGLDGCPGA